MKVAEEDRITVMHTAWSPVDLIREIIETGTQEDPFYVMDLGEVVTRYHRWKELMPRVVPFYAVKCNNSKLLLSTLAALGTGFDCASKTEIELITSIGVEPEGVSFHVGSGAIELAVYGRAVALCRVLFDVGASVGHKNMRLLDLGGGFPGAINTDLYEASQVINTALEEHFPSNDVRVIAEPGRYFAEAAYTLATCVHSKREITSKDGNIESTMYFIDDGVFGSFNCVLSYQQQMPAEPLYPTSEEYLPCSVWGPTLDGKDCVLSATRLPKLRVGDWLLFRDMGAYTFCAACNFNGFSAPKVREVVDACIWSELKGSPLLSSFQTVIGEPMSSPSPGRVSPSPLVEGVPPNDFVECAAK